jgi:predicted ATP-grasp superfamily ATP-dependent carboligase
MVVTVGAAIAEVPHTRRPQVVGSTTSSELAQRLGLARPSYEGVTGLIGVVHERLERAELPAISLRVGVPHYLAAVPHPLATVALLQHLEHVLGVPTSHAELDDDVDEWRRHHDEAVALDPDAVAYVERLESTYDEQVAAEVPSADELAAELEAFLRDHRDE